MNPLGCEVVGRFPSKRDIEEGFNVESQAMINLGPPEWVALLPQGYAQWPTDTHPHPHPYPHEQTNTHRLSLSHPSLILPSSFPRPPIRRYHLAVCHDETLSLFFVLHNRLELCHTFPVSHCFKCFVSRGGNLIAAVSGHNVEVFQTFPQT